MITDEPHARAYVRSVTDSGGFERLELFAKLIIEENGNQNLIAKATEDCIWRRHIADSAQLLENVSRETILDQPVQPWLDIGSGPGFPGLVIAAIVPGLMVVLMEPRNRRVDFLNKAVNEMGLANVRVESSKIENAAPFPARIISARAFAPLDKLLRLSAPFSTTATRYVLPKGRSAAQELAALRPALREMFHVKHSLTDSEAGIIVSR